MSKVIEPVRRHITQHEREAAVYLLGVAAAFKIRGKPAAMPKAVFDSVIETAKDILQRPNDKELRNIEFRVVDRMVSTANDFGFKDIGT